MHKLPLINRLLRSAALLLALLLGLLTVTVPRSVTAQATFVNGTNFAASAAGPNDYMLYYKLVGGKYVWYRDPVPDFFAQFTNNSAGQTMLGLITNNTYRVSTNVSAMALLVGTLDTNHFINPFMFGGVGDGVHDDTAAVQAAIDAASATTFNKHYVDLMNHTWRITSTLQISSQYTWFGDGQIITTNQIHAIWSANDNIHFHDLIVGGPSTNFQAGSCGIWVSNNAYIIQNYFDSVKVTNFWDNIYVNFGVETHFNHVISTAQGNTSINLYACDETEIKNSALGMSMATGFNNDVQASGTGTGWSQTNSIALYTFEGQGFDVHDNDFNECGCAIYCDAGPVPAQGLTIIHLDKNNFEQFYNPTLPCVVFTNDVQGEVSNNHFHNDLFSGSTNAAIGVYNNATDMSLFIHNNVHSPYYVYVDEWNSNPDVLGDHSGNFTGAQSILAHSTFGDAGTFRGPTILDGYTPYDRLVSLDNGVQGQGLIIGANNGGYGNSANTTKSYTVEGTAYGDSHAVGILRYDDLSTAKPELYIGNNNYGATPGCSYVYIGTSPNDTSGPTNWWQFDYAGGLNTLRTGQAFGGTTLFGTFTNTTSVANVLTPSTFAPFAPVTGAQLFTDGTNLIVTIKNGGFTHTNKVSLTTWP